MTRLLDPRCLSYMAFFDMSRDVYQALPPGGPPGGRGGPLGLGGPSGGRGGPPGGNSGGRLTPVEQWGHRGLPPEQPGQGGGRGGSGGRGRVVNENNHSTEVETSRTQRDFENKHLTEVESSQTQSAHLCEHSRLRSVMRAPPILD
jgi:hypothetical protein